jgi:hypothetical protein
MNADREGKKKPREGRIQNHFCVIRFYYFFIISQKKRIRSY